MILSSQLVEISQRFRRDVEDLQVLLEAEGLPVGAAGGVEELATRLGSDPRFRSDVAFLVNSMLGRGSDGRGAGGLGSMEVLGILLVAGGGTRQEFDTPPRQQIVRELLRFVSQQRRPAVAAASRFEEPVAEDNPAETSAISPDVSEEQECRSSAPRIPRSAEELPVLRSQVAVPSLVNEELGYSSQRRPHAGWIVATLAVLVALGTWWVMQRDSSKATTPEVASVKTPQAVKAPSGVSRVYPSVSAPERRVILAPARRSVHNLRKPSPRARRGTAGRAQPVQASAPVSAPIMAAANVPSPNIAADVPPKRAETRQALPQPAREPNQAASSSTPERVPAPNSHQPAAVSMPVLQKRSPPGPIDVSKVFAHPEAGTEVADNQVPPAEFHTADPVLLRRNAPPPATEPQGSVHGGSAGAMAGNLMYSPDPEYPAEAIAAGVAGEVTVRAVVGPHGNVVDADVVSGPPMLRQAALDAIGQWRFRPYEQDGKPVTVATTAIFDFEIPQSR